MTKYQNKMRLQTFNIKNASNVDGKGWFVSLGINPTIRKIDGVDNMGFPKIVNSDGSIAKSFFVSSNHLRTPEIGYSAFKALMVDDCVDNSGNVIKPVKLAKLCKEYFKNPLQSASAKYWKSYSELLTD